MCWIDDRYIYIYTRQTKKIYGYMWIMILWDIYIYMYIYILLCKQGLNQGKYGGPMGFNGVCVYIYITGHSRISWDVSRDSMGYIPKLCGCFLGNKYDTFS